MHQFLFAIRQNIRFLLPVITGYFIPVITNLSSSWLESTIGKSPARLIQVTLILGAFVLVLWLFVRTLSLDRRKWVIIEEDRHPPKKQGLIVLVGPGRQGEDPLKTAVAPAIDHHLENGDLKVCWLLYTQSSTHVMEAFKKHYEGRVKMIAHRVTDEYDDVDDTFRLVREIYEREAPDLGLAAEQIIADFTGGTKLMTAGMTLACGEQYPMQYVGHKPGTDITTSTPLYVAFQFPTQEVNAGE